MQKAIAIVEKLSDVQTVSLLKQIELMLSKAIPPGAVEAHLPEDLEGVSLLRKLSPATKASKADPTVSVTIAKGMLRAMAADDNLAPLVVRAWDEVKSDDSLFVGAAIAVGLMANLALFLVTTELEFEVKNLKIKKGKASAEVIREVLRPLTEFVKKIGRGL